MFLPAGDTGHHGFLPFPFNHFPHRAVLRAQPACYSEVMDQITKSNPNGHDRAADRAAMNKTNAQKSTGPRTEAGKQRSKLNALRHGLSGQTIVLPTEDHAAYQHHSQRLFEHFRPVGALEEQLVQALSDTSWRLNRAAAVEANLYSLGITENENRIHASHPEAEVALAMALTFRENVHAFANISIYAQRIARQFERTLAQLREIQAERRQNEEDALDRAADLLEMHQDKKLPYIPAQDGFVFSNDQIETFIQRRDRLSEARTASLQRFEAAG